MKYGDCSKNYTNNTHLSLDIESEPFFIAERYKEISYDMMFCLRFYVKKSNMKDALVYDRDLISINVTYEKFRFKYINKSIEKTQEEIVIIDTQEF